MVRSLEAGHTLPPIIADKASKRIVDGVHRWTAWRKFSGDEAVEVPVLLKSYRDEGQLFLDAVRLNASHGVALNSFDRARCLMRAQELKLEPAEIADALSMTVEKAGALRQERGGYLRTPGIDGTNIVAFTKEKLIPLKRTIRHMAGKTLSAAQAKVNDKLSGMDAIFYVRQLSMLLTNGLIDMSDAKLMAALDTLASEIEELRVAK
jgi:ParB-like chromosome segregation protein Spo0J